MPEFDPGPIRPGFFNMQHLDLLQRVGEVQMMKLEKRDPEDDVLQHRFFLAVPASGVIGDRVCVYTETVQERAIGYMHYDGTGHHIRHAGREEAWLAVQLLNAFIEVAQGGVSPDGTRVITNDGAFETPTKEDNQ